VAGAWDLQKSLYAHLAPILAALEPPVPLFDEAPANQHLPYVEIARHILTPSDGFDHFMSQALISLSVYSDGARGMIGGQGHVLSILETMAAALRDARLPLPGSDGEVIRCRPERMDNALDADGRTHVGSLIVSILFRH
jgi:hypothetical protein